MISNKLKKLLNKSLWSVSNPIVNAQAEIHDADVEILRLRDHKKIRIECKLAKNASFTMKGKVRPNSFSVKCMRSRTVSDNEVATKMAEKYRVPREMVLDHPDNYRAQDFDFVITTMGNSLWKTTDKKYGFIGTKGQEAFLNQKFPDHFPILPNLDRFQHNSFNFLLIAPSKDLVVGAKNNLKCSRIKCKNRGNSLDCGFIPNYPVVKLSDVELNNGAWRILSDIDLNSYFNNFLDETV